ncbi:MAG: hypothetical protein M1283_02800 [Gammaproteobacteria bacterium]|nr:hypothetical protein [Gammaproteobacteria bacterium]
MLERGSEWRRWDLHVHTPETALNDQFGSWDEYLAEINAQTQVRVIGVTDYFLFGNYSKLKAYRADGKLPEIDLLIPNIEFRIAPPTDKATALNIHILVSPVDSEHEQKMHNALARLTWEYGKDNYSCVRDQLITFGKAIDPAITDERAALEQGVVQFKIDFSELRKWYNSETWLKANSIVVAAAGDDGLSGFYKDGAWAAWRDEITRFCQALFSGRPGERDFWLCRKSKEDAETVMKLGGPKPCLHGSDAHKIADLFRPAENRSCWIKADPTFEGLRQVLYEPADRVHIGPTAPLYHDEARVISAVRLSHSDGWFDDVEIPLNAGLVSIIGQKGSGKSALAELIAYAAGSWITDEAGSFLKRAGVHLKEMKAELVWADGEITPVMLGDEQSDDRAVRYLSQKFVERLCADDHLGDELVEEIENVIYSYIDESDKLNASSFQELRSMRTDGTRAEGQRLRDDITRLIAEACELREKERAVPEKKKSIKTLADERKGLEKQLPKAASKEEEKTQKALQEKRTALSALQKEAGVDKQKLQKIRDIRTALTSFTARMGRFYSELEPDLKEVGIPEAERAVFKPTFPGDTEKPLAAREAAIKISIAKREGDAENPAQGTIKAIEKEIAELAKKESVDQARAKRIQEIQKRIGAIDTETERLNKEIAQIEGPNKKRTDAVARERMDAYTAYFRNLKTEQTTLEELYGPVTAHLKSEDSFAQEQELEFSIRWEVDLKTWLERGGALFDQRRTTRYGTIEGLTKAANDILVPAWTSGDPEKIKPALDKFLEPFRTMPTSQYRRTGVSIQDIFEWLYETEHIRLSYGLKYNGTELEKLSPGTKGIVLLILYLGMDVADSRPLIVDQPDENLDNESIYELLTEYFKTAKARRQIILITHNPNLVVNGDSEQVIIATAARRASGLPHITYNSGALENPEIRAQVCRILEGGSTAFRKREKRYALPVS